ncbi:MAG: hypothetical protein L6Q31_03435 [Fimbriimonadaceae bacterium]|nr:hypothetical protein [Fimbriimonadaceae bacterium]NUM39889.1 hypothetical protein [Armatimonadota bacterium]
MLFSKRKKRYENLAEFLERNAGRSHTPNPGAGVVAVSSLLLSGALYFALLRFLGPIGSMLATAFVGLPLIGISLHLILREAFRPKDARSQRIQEMARIYRLLWVTHKQNRLTKDLDPTLAELLDECARHWLRIHRALGGPFWTQETLPVHWKGVRDRAIEASSLAMDDVLLILESHLYKRETKTNWQDVVNEFVEDLLDQPPKRSPTAHLPPEYDPAREVAERLKLLAAEVEQAAKEVLREEAFDEVFGGSKALEACLSELKSIREAETELDGELRVSE